MLEADLVPRAVEAEQSLLGAIFQNNEAYSIAASIVRPEHFFEPMHAKIFELCGEAIASGRVVTPITLKDKLPDNCGIGITSFEYLIRLHTEATTVLNTPDYALTIRDMWGLRRVAELAEIATSKVVQPGADPKVSIADLLTGLDSVRADLDDRAGTRKSAGECASDILHRIERIQLGEIEQGATTGIKRLDDAMGGLKAGELVIVAGRPGMGKTIVGAGFARAASKAGSGVIMFSLEMGQEQITSRMMADISYHPQIQITGKEVMEGKLDQRAIQRLMMAAEEMSRLPLEIDFSTNLTVSDLAAKTRVIRDKMRARGVRLGVVVIDYLKFVRASDRYRGQRVYEVGEITAGLKAMAKDMGICIVLLAQLNRAVEQRNDRRPELSDLRESGDIEADADVVLLLFREAYYLKDKDDPESIAKMIDCENKLEVIIAKCRMGATGTVDVFCHPGASAIRDWVKY